MRERNPVFQSTESEKTTQEMLVRVIKDIRTNKSLQDKMRSERRWGRFTDDKDVRLNPDTYQLGHALNTYRIARDVTNFDVAHGNIDSKQRIEMRIAALIHDVGELKNGDKNFWVKTESDQAEEKSFFENELGRLLPATVDNDVEAAKKLLQIHHGITQGKKEEGSESEYFYVIECLGYLSAALDFFKERQEGFNWEHACVSALIAAGKTLDNYLKRYECTRQYLIPRLDELKEMLTYFKGRPLNPFEPFENMMISKGGIDFAACDSIVRQVEEQKENGK